MNRSGSDLTLRCFAEKKSRIRWYVHCIDLTVDAEASSYAEAREKLDDAIVLYLDWAREHFAERGGVLRPSPIEFRVRYYRAWMISRCSSLWATLRRHPVRASAPDATYKRTLPNVPIASHALVA